MSTPSKLPLIIILALPLLGLMLAIVTYALRLGPEAQTNQGILLSPTLQLDALGIPLQQEGQQQTLWRLIYVRMGACETHCQQRLDGLNRLHQALGKHRDRVAPVAITHSGAQLPEPLTWMGASIDTTRIQSALASQGCSPTLDCVMIADPLGNIMLLYTDAHTDRQILHDLKQLLKYSNIG